MAPEKLAARFEEELRQLATSEKLIIGFLTELAKDYIVAAPLIVKEIEAKLLVRKIGMSGVNVHT